MSAVLGIDPGNSGAFALVNDHGIFCVRDMPVVDGWVSPALLDVHLGALVEHGDVDLAVVEKVRSMPGQGVASTFKFGAGWGMCVMAVASLPLEQPTPAKWKKAMGLSKNKGASRAMALDLWPGDAERFQRVKDDGRAEACLLAEWGRRLLAERRGGEQ